VKLFVDTSGLFAAIDRRDVQHPHARPTLEHLLREKVEMHTTSYVVLETLTLLQARIGLPAAIAFQQDLKPLLHITWMTDALHQRAFQRLLARQQRKLSMVDCASFVVMEELELTAVFGYDAHFAKQGFRLVGRVGDLVA
jgi:predicted nucleic acid-binding protein